MSESHYRWDLARAAMMIAAVFIFYRVLVPASADMPLNDDWAYAQSVRHLLNTGELRVTDWATAALIPQIIWGTLFAALSGGFSFVVLHTSTLIFGAISALALYDLLRQLNQRHALALLGTLLLLVNPVFVNLSYTFLTDIFYLGLMLLSCVLYIRGFKTNSNRLFFLASVGAALAYLERQLGAVLPIAAAMVLVLQRRRWPWSALLSIAALPLLTILVHQVWMHATNNVPWATELVAAGGLDFLRHWETLVTILLRAAWSILYLGLFTLPLLVARWATAAPDRATTAQWLKLFGLWTLGLAIPVLIAIAATGQSMPYLANIINHNGLGSLTLAGDREMLLPTWLFWLVTAMAPLAGAAFAATGSLWIRRRPYRAGDLLLMLDAAGTATLSLTFVLFWDRYLLALLPIAIYAALRLVPTNRMSLIVGVVISAFIAAFSLYGTADYLAWTTARWSAGQQLVMQGVSPAAIEGGIEWVGWYDFETALPLARAIGRGSEILGWMEITPKSYRLAFVPLPGYHVAGVVDYARPLHAGTAQIYILQRP